MKIKKRLDVLLVERLYADSRTKAQAIIMSGNVYVNGQKADKPGTAFEETVEIEVRGAVCPYVSRGGLKLEKALRDFGVKPDGYVCSDSGASTGGFTDCLLQNGAIRVHAVDVGTNQLVWKLRNDPRVIVKEQFNARYMTPADLGEKVQLIVSDVSFISLTRILPAAYDCLEDGGDMLVLIKPQFELQPEDIGPGGIVRDPALHQRAVDKIRDFVTNELKREWCGVADSPITGMEGHKEFLAWLR